MDLNGFAAAFVAICVAAGGVFGLFKFGALRAAVVALLTESPHSLREALDSLASVVQAQGDSIAWLRSELDSARTELELTRTALRENTTLRERVAELEELVRSLEQELTRRRKYTRKDFLPREEESGAV